RDTGFAVQLRSADNSVTCYRSWSVLNSLGVDVREDNERMPFSLVGASIARLRLETDGWSGMGGALRLCCDDEKRGELKLLRLLACEQVGSLCTIVRPMLRYITEKTPNTLSHARLLDDMLRFRFDNSRQRVKKDWAWSYYHVKQIGAHKAQDAASEHSRTGLED
ncbi:MAG: type I-E CRISPR-associated protein Cse2/CasB, partial [Desulfovibrionaceae bacterium]|nr:type I-E CRISPR-associated protein Cse2/CasB [Desulfovibrionaceae bacterium]